ncbi:hypothetical protein KKB28_02880 [bacterium]|nr:hypothetical protein [bacterium]
MTARTVMGGFCALLMITASAIAQPDSLNVRQLALLHDYWDRCHDVAVVGDYAYCATEHSGLRVVNISNPALPYEMGFYDTPGKALGVTVSGSYAYVADEFEGFRVVNITNPASPYE